MSKFLYPIYKLKTKSYIKWWLYHKKAGGGGTLSEILQGFSFNLENTLNRKFKLFEIEGNSTQETTEGKNKLSFTENTISYAGVTTNISETKMKFNGKMTSVTNIFNTIREDKVISAGTYTLSYTKLSGSTSGSGDWAIYFNFYNANGTKIANKNFASNESGTAKDLVLSEDVAYYNYYAYCNSTSLEFNNLELGFMIEPGTTATNYEPYTGGIASPNPSYEQPIKSAGDNGTINEKITNADGTKEQDYSIYTQQPFRSIGDVRDCFVKKDGSWYERHYILRKIFDGTENWVYSYNNFVLARQSVNTHLANSECLSNSYIYSSTALSGEYGIRTGNADFIQIRDTNYDNVTDFKAMLAEKYANGNPVYADYILETPLDLPCTETQIEQLENLPSTYKDFTIIYSQDETPAHLKIQYYKEG